MNRRDKVAVMGTSPIMLILAYHLSRSADVVIHEREKVFGGAWSKKMIEDVLLGTKTNVIVPLNCEQDEIVEKMNHYLANTHGVSITNSTKLFQMELPYTPKKIYDYDLEPLFRIPQSDSLEIDDQSIVIAK